MKNLFATLLLLTSISMIYSSCYYRRNCGPSDNIKLGETDYSDKFKEYNIERFEDTLIFKSSSNVLTLIRGDMPNKRPGGVREYSVCKGIGLKVYTAYAYYEYENLNSMFYGDSATLRISPNISAGKNMRRKPIIPVSTEKNMRREALFLSFSKGIPGAKGRVPVSNIDTTKTYSPFGELFKYHESIELNGEVFQHIWFFKRYQEGIYYSKTLGVVALEVDNEIFIRI